MIYLEGQPSFFMISSETPYKLAEIIRDTWPQIYRVPLNKKDEKGSSIRIRKNES
jgi:hypothetical protein